jgi:hypothetical protein
MESVTSAGAVNIASPILSLQLETIIVQLQEQHQKAQCDKTDALKDLAYKA